MDQQSLASPLEDTRNTTVDVVIDIAQFKTESARLQTFRCWPSRYAHIRPADLANAGFIYVGRDDLVRCVFCGQYVGNWEQEDFPMTEHRLLFPECPFILGRDVGNVPITHPDTAMQLPTQSGSSHDSYDETGIRPSAGRQINSGPEKGKIFIITLFLGFSFNLKNNCRIYFRHCSNNSLSRKSSFFVFLGSL